MTGRQVTNPGRSFLLRPTSSLRRDDDGRRLVGGTPLRIMTLSASGATIVRDWFRGEPVGPEPAHQELARRLVEADIATAAAIGSTSDITDVAVVVPVKNDAMGLATTLDALRVDPGGQSALSGTKPAFQVVVVDDGSDPPLDASIGDAARASVTIIRRSESAGPGSARNLGASQVDESVIVFVDSGVIISPEQLGTLARELVIGDTLAVAPRVRSAPGSSRLANYERSWSPLDLGSEPGLVGPGRRVSYVPSTCLAVRSSTLTELGGFDPGLRYGEDVDLVWRLAPRGWIRYVPEIVVTHPPRSTVSAFVSQRFRYGTSAGPLARRHGRAVAPARLDRRSAFIWAAILAGWYRSAALIAGWSTVSFVSTLVGRGVPRGWAVRFALSGWLATTRGLAVSVARTWWPVVVLAAAASRLRLAPALLAVGWLRRLRRQGKPSTEPKTHGSLRVADIGTDLALGVVDDSAYALGVWRGAIGARTVHPILPNIAHGPDVTGR